MAEHVADLVMRARIAVVPMVEGTNRWLAYVDNGPNAGGGAGATKEEAVANLLAGLSPGARTVTWVDEAFGSRVIARGPGPTP